MGLGEFLRKTVTWPYCYSSLASRVMNLAIASDEDHRSPREQEWSPRELHFAARHSEQVYSPWRVWAESLQDFVFLSCEFNLGCL